MNKNTVITLSRNTVDYGHPQYQPTNVHMTIADILKAVDQAGDWLDYINEPERITAADGLYSIAEELDIDTTNYELFDELEEAITEKLEQAELEEQINKFYEATPSEEKEFEEHKATKIYNYENALRNDILSALKYEEETMKRPDETYPEWADRLYESFIMDDFITGNASGSHTFNTVIAAEYLVGNDDLARDAFEELGYPEDPSKLLDPEYVDVIIRCDLLSEILNNVVSDLESGVDHE